MPLTAQQVVELTTWVDQYAAQTDRLIASSAATVASYYAGVNLANSAAVLAAAQQAANTSSAATVIGAGLASQYLAMTTATMTGAPVPVPNLPPLPGRRVTDPFKVYNRPGKLYARQIAKGVPPIEAFEQAMRLTELLVDTDVRLSQRQMWDQVLRYLAPQLGITHYRRIVRPELSRTGTCGLCIVASDNTYKVRDLMPLHDRCKCVVLPIIGDNDPGSSLNNLELGDVYAESVTSHGWDLKNVRYRVEEHGEKGPVLVLADHAFTGPDDLAPAR